MHGKVVAKFKNFKNSVISADYKFNKKKEKLFATTIPPVAKFKKKLFTTVFTQKIKIKINIISKFHQ